MNYSVTIVEDLSPPSLPSDGFPVDLPPHIVARLAHTEQTAIKALGRILDT